MPALRQKELKWLRKKSLQSALAGGSTSLWETAKRSSGLQHQDVCQP
jgi:hypothetical protein